MVTAAGWTRRRLLVQGSLAVLAVSGLAGLSGCGADLTLVRADLPRATPAPPDASTSTMLADLAGAWLGRTDRKVNLICSPLSVAVVLAMVRNGAAGRTAEEMDSALGLPALEVLNAGMNTVTQELGRRSGKRERSSGKKGTVELSLANQIWGLGGMTWEQPFLDTMARSYGTGVAELDFGNPAAAARTINDWVSDQTDGKIPDVVPPDGLDVETRMALANAVRVKAAWDVDFDEGDQASFQTADGVVDAAMMRRSGTLLTTRKESWSAVRVPYIGRELEMTVFLSAVGREAQMLTELADGGLHDAIAGGEMRWVELTMPKFSFRSKLELGELLSDLGMPTAFSDAADFSGLTRQESLKIDKVFHQGWIAVDEKGTEAAAATVATMTPVSAGPPVEKLTLTLDRPFAFVVNDRALAVPIMAGWVADPSDGR